MIGGAFALALAVSGCGGSSPPPAAATSPATASLYQQLGGMSSVNQMASNFVTSSMKDPRLAGLLGNVNSSAATSKVADQLCAALGGGCRPAFSEQQVAAAADRLTPAQKTAVSDNFMTSLNSLTSNPALRDSVSRVLGSRMNGIVGAVV
jgi:truncated hemoglobin YjbI